MLYKKHQLFDNEIEIMLPSKFVRQDDLFRENLWVSEDRRVVISITRGIKEVSEKELILRLQDYYLEYSQSVHGFKCMHIKKRVISGYEYAEMYYRSENLGYVIENVILLGSYRESELFMTFQCGQSDAKEYLHVFENVMDSITMIRKQKKSLVAEDEVV